MSDLISRSALIRTIKCRKDVHKVEYAHDKRESDFIRCCECSEIERLVNETPTVEAKLVVHGEWIDTQPDYHPGCGNNAHVCSICGDYYTTEPEDLFFCPRCGADMRGGKND